MMEADRLRRRGRRPRLPRASRGCSATWPTPSPAARRARRPRSARSSTSCAAHARLLVEPRATSDCGVRDFRKHVGWYLTGYPVGGGRAGSIWPQSPRSPSSTPCSPASTRRRLSCPDTARAAAPGPHLRPQPGEPAARLARRRRRPPPAGRARAPPPAAPTAGGGRGRARIFRARLLLSSVDLGGARVSYGDVAAEAGFPARRAASVRSSPTCCPRMAATTSVVAVVTASGRLVPATRSSTPRLGFRGVAARGGAVLPAGRRRLAGRRGPGRDAPSHTLDQMEIVRRTSQIDPPEVASGAGVADTHRGPHPGHVVVPTGMSRRTCRCCWTSFGRPACGPDGGPFVDDSDDDMLLRSPTWAGRTAVRLHHRPRGHAPVVWAGRWRMASPPPR